MNSDSVKDFFRKIFPKKPDASLKTEIKELIEEHQQENGVQPKDEESIILQNVIEIGDVRVMDVMTPRSEIMAVKETATFTQLRDFIAEKEHTRIPVSRENMDDVAGFIHVKDLFKFWNREGEFKIAEILRPVLFVPPSMKILHLLEKMKKNRTHMAIVVDEYGGTDGLVTNEDLKEKIVGEIEDEHDSESGDIKKISDDVYEDEARVEINKVEELLGVKIYDDETENFDTIGGLVFTTLGKIPEIGESLEHKCGLSFKVIDADNRRIKKVKIIRNLLS
jgi:CBS domain containing-hemolysin-like protein